MAAITRNEINNDMAVLISSIQDEDRPLVKPLAAFRLCAAWPLSCISVYFLAVAWLALTYTPEYDPFGNELSFLSYMSPELGFCAFTAILGLAVSVGLYMPSLIYLSVPKDVRSRSMILINIKKTIKRLAVLTFLINLAVAIAACTYNEIIIGAAPFVFLASFIAMQLIVSAEVTRYGIGSLMNKMSTLVRKI